MESSGNESSRKRVKKQATGSVRGSRASTPMSSSQRIKTGAMSDGEATGGEMSDAGYAKKKVPRVTMVSGSQSKGTPASSRAGSPAPVAGQTSPSGMRPTHPSLEFGTGLLTVTSKVHNHPRAASLISLSLRVLSRQLMSRMPWRPSLKA